MESGRRARWIQLTGAAGSLYTLQPGDAAYERFPADAPLRTCIGYWAVFPNGGSLQLGAGSSACTLALNPGQWTMVSNPSPAQTAIVSQADTVLTYTSVGGYRNMRTIPVGSGAWVISARAVNMTVSEPASAPLRRFASPPPFTIDATAIYTATISTDKGDVVVTLDPSAAPNTVNNFVFLARQHFYDGLTCHRVIPFFVAQCGDPLGNGAGGPDYSIPDESSPLKHDAGVIAMAKAGPDTGGSQFYITLTPQHQLDGLYTVFGRVTSGFDVVQQFNPHDPFATPASSLPADVITTVTIDGP